MNRPALIIAGVALIVSTIALPKVAIFIAGIALIAGAWKS